MSEPLQIRWRRRVVSIPAVLGITTGAVLGLPILLAAATVVDLGRGRRRLPTVRVYLFGLQYLLNDSLEILLAPLLWIRAGFGTTLGSGVSKDRHLQLQNWSVRTLADRADQLLDLPVEVVDEEQGAPGSGPLVVIGRHVSLFDASLPGLVLERLQFKVRGVIMAELLADPGFDLIYSRTGSVFIPRDDGQTAVRAVQSMAKDADHQTALVIFPEGRLFRPSVRDRLLSRLAESDPERAERLAGLRHVLPPRPGGLHALLDAVPDADVVLLDHRGLDDFQRLADLVHAVPVGRPVRISLRRFVRADIPEGLEARTAWLDRIWMELDNELEQEQTEMGADR